jgi:hypothetical protein
MLPLRFARHLRQFILFRHCCVESKRGRIRRVGAIHRVKAVVLIAAGLTLQSFGQEGEKTKSISPDEKWEFRLIETDSTSKDDAGGRGKLVACKSDGHESQHRVNGCETSGSQLRC